MKNLMFAQRTNDVRLANQLRHLMFAQRTTKPRLVRLANQSGHFSPSRSSLGEHLISITSRVARFGALALAPDFSSTAHGAKFAKTKTQEKPTGFSPQPWPTLHERTSSLRLTCNGTCNACNGYPDTRHSAMRMRSRCTAKTHWVSRGFPVGFHSSATRASRVVHASILELNK